MSPFGACVVVVVCMSIMLGGNAHCYQNPLTVPSGEKGEAIIADPGIIRWMGKYYLYATKVVEDPGISCWESKDLVNWKFKSFCTGEDPAFGNRMAWNPAPFYYNGKFYLYVCSSDQKHRAFVADDPAGPFACVNDDLIDTKGLDAMPFLDDDGQLYIFYSGWGGIQYRKCSSPIKADGENHQLKTCKFSAIPENEWMEGPSMYKKDGTYYLCYCGNDWIKDSYQVQTARAKAIPDLKPQKSNPLLAELSGEWVATGCNHAIIGPDLKSLWTIYHCRKAGGHVRRLCLDRLHFDPKTGDLISDGPTWTPQANPEKATWSESFERTDLGASWQVVDGDWKLNKGFVQGNGNTSQMLCRMSTGDSFTAEFNVRLAEPDKISDKADYGMILCSSGQQGLYLAIDTASKNLVLWNMQGAKKAGKPLAKAAIPADFKLDVWHTLLVEKNDNRVQVRFDDMLKIDTSVSIPGGKLGFASNGCAADFGWFGFSN